MASPTLYEKLDKIRDPNLESQRQTRVVLAVIDETLKEQSAEPPSAAGYFAVLLSLLARASAAQTLQEDKAICLVYLLDVVSPFVPPPLLRAKFTQIFTHLAPALALHGAPATLLKSSIGCLEALLLAQDASSWSLTVDQIGPRRAVAGLLNLALDVRPKIRKRAQDALRKVLRNPPSNPSLDHPAADMCAETAMGSLAEKATLQRGKRGPGRASNQPDLIHALQLIRAVASATGGWPSKKIEPLCELLFEIGRTGSTHLTVSVFEVFEMMFEGMAEDVARSKLPRLLEIVSELHPAAHDTQLIPAWIAILSRAYDVSAQMEPMGTFQALPEVFASVAEYMGSTSENIRISASECLVSFLANCVPSTVLLNPSIFDEKVLERLVETAEGLLSIQYQAAWSQIFRVLGAMFDALRWRSDPILINAVRVIGELRASPSFAGKKEADELLGRAIRALGPAAILEALPLNLALPTNDQPGRVWLLPLLRDFTSNTKLSHFRAEFIPLSETMFQRVLDSGDAEKTMRVKIFETVIQQIWSILPGYCDLPLDLVEAFDEAFAEQISNLLYQQVELRLDICRALRALVESNQSIIDSTASVEDDAAAEDLVLQSRVSRKQARQNLDYLGTFASKMLAVLFNVYSQTLPHSRGPILQTANAFLSITSPEELRDTFKRLGQMLTAALNDSAPSSQHPGVNPTKAGQLPGASHTLMDLVVTMAIHLPRESFSTLFNIASTLILKEDDPQLQKKAYKLIPRLAGCVIGKAALADRHQELQALILTSADKVSAPARRDRLAAIAALLPAIPASSLHFIPSVVPEVIVSCKEHNERARNAAFDLLVLMGHRILAGQGTLIEITKVPHMGDDALPVTASIEEFFTILGAGLASHEPHVMSASVTAITRVLFEFHHLVASDTLVDIVKTVELFLTANNRELVKSVLGFVKACLTALPADIMAPRLTSLVPGVIAASHEHKGHFRSRVKHILERMVRRFGFEAVFKHCPEMDRKLINGIRKSKERSARHKEAVRNGHNQDAAEGSEDQSRRQNRFESEYDHALFDSDEDGSGNSDGSGDEMPGATTRRKRNVGGAYIVEDEDEPLDLLGWNALAKISSSKPTQQRQKPRSKMNVNTDGKLILGPDVRQGDVEFEDPADTDADNNGVGAYVAALKGKDVPKRGLRGRLKWSNKRTAGAEDDDDEDEGMENADTTYTHTGSPNAAHSINHRRAAKTRPSPLGDRGRKAGKGTIPAIGRRRLGEGKRRGLTAQGGVAKPSSNRITR